MCVHDSKESINFEIWVYQSDKKFDIVCILKIAFFIPIECDDSFHYAIYAIMRQAVGDAKNSYNSFFNNFKNMQKKFR